MRLALNALASTMAVALSLAAPANAEVKVKLEEVVGGLTHPLAMVSIPDGSGRKAVIEQHGLVRIIDQRGRLLPEPFLNIQAKLVHLEPFFEEQGLLGIAFHPDYKSNGKFYIAYSAPLRGDAILDKKLWWAHTNTVSEMTVSKESPNRANANSEKIISQIDWPQFNHNGHWIAFGPDGKLYVSTGDGGYANDWGIGHNVTTGNGQDLTTPLGKMLRLDVDKEDLIPADNPYVGRNDANPQIWAHGLRNPWRCSFDMRGERELYCGDVQQNSFEEVSIVTKGANLGWRKMEADKCFDYVNPNVHPASCDKTGLVEPIMVYKNCTAIPQDCLGISVTGGYVYRGAHKPWDGKYIFGDWSKSFKEMDGQIFFGTKGSDGKWTLEKASVQGMNPLPYILAFGQDEAGEVYALTSISTGPVGGHDKIYRIVPTD
ncbi:MAG TPA: PQQ-dependent sugar dehydrogenase [Beijerinckiaceae bacterium]|nr:PQQ-dependent sugar dehydrogenase [Beijerinckiaceae bacterium]